MNVKILRSKYATEGVHETGVAADDRRANEVVHAQDDLERCECHECQEPVRSEKDVHWVLVCRNIQIDGARARRAETMAKGWRMGDCVRLPDGRIGRVRTRSHGHYRVRVRRTTSATHQFLTLAGKDLKKANCPKGWMSPKGYARYLTATLAKMRQRRAVPGRRS